MLPKNEQFWEQINKATKDDLLSMTMDYKNGRITAGNLMDRIDKRCKAVLDKNNREWLEHIEGQKTSLVRLRMKQDGSMAHFISDLSTKEQDKYKTEAGQIIALFKGKND